MDALAQIDPLLIAFTALGLCLLALIILVITLVRQTKLLRRYRLLLNGESGRNLESLLLTQGNDLETMKETLSALTRRVDNLATDALHHVQRTAIVRFSAFPDTGSDLSFAIAILDAHDNGFVISSLYGRTESRIYAKPISGGTSTYTLSDEEKQALSIARNQAR